ncbi:hypothetical protein [Aliiroseovarius sp. F47248L]|uniref:hypothetical protein n=1 Tax=Aliiroseovarius sp. F47248L TaxID=2926420 RepID=UPI001FF635FB|nr:hypothetical protein [Aliiroseovarius sp. F47248L]MCK0138099.1 hypothetical protein [Aliiroseovarius sp. F47248L]
MPADVKELRDSKAPRAFVKYVGFSFFAAWLFNNIDFKLGRLAIPIARNSTQGAKFWVRFNHLFNMMLVNRLMLQVWKIEVPTPQDADVFREGWALAKTKREALELAGNPSARVKRMPEHLWIAKERVIWPSPDCNANTAAR